jgi:hypothetical protein
MGEEYWESRKHQETRTYTSNNFDSGCDWLKYAETRSKAEFLQVKLQVKKSDWTSSEMSVLELPLYAIGCLYRSMICCAGVGAQLEFKRALKRIRSTALAVFLVGFR